LESASAAKSNRALTRDLTEEEASQISKTVWDNASKTKRVFLRRYLPYHRQRCGLHAK
jgi:hypothetical protein